MRTTMVMKGYEIYGLGVGEMNVRTNDQEYKRYDFCSGYQKVRRKWGLVWERERTPL